MSHNTPLATFFLLIRLRDMVLSHTDKIRAIELLSCIRDVAGSNL